MIGKQFKNADGRIGKVKATRKEDGIVVEVLVFWPNGQTDWIDPAKLETIQEGNGAA